jgi:hypothetical protein
MPINQSLAAALKKKYGAKKGEGVYFAMENSKGKTGAAYKKGLKTAKKEGHTQSKFPNQEMAMSHLKNKALTA